MSRSLSAEEILRSAYSAFNARDVEAAVELMHPEVDWPNAWEGGRMVGRPAVRDYWSRQFAAISSKVEPEAFTEESDGSITVDVHQVVHDAHTGELISDGRVRHRYSLEDGLVVRMDVLESPDRVSQEKPMNHALGRLPSILLRLEGAAVFGASIALYLHADYSVLALVVLFLVPDLSILAFFAGARVGAAAYDAVHTELWPIVLASLGVVIGTSVMTQVGLIWLAHIGIDRVLGYGLKYPTGFKDTHLSRV